jgi:hypothetical protein
MSRGTWVLALLLVALALHLGITRPAARAQGMALLRRVSRMDLPDGTPGDDVARLRRALLESLRDQPVSGVRLAVSAARPPLAAQARVEATGSFDDVVRLTGRLVRPGAGLVLARVTMAATPGGLDLLVEGASLLAASP